MMNRSAWLQDRLPRALSEFALAGGRTLRRLSGLAKLGAAMPPLRQLAPGELAFAIAGALRHLLALGGKLQEVVRGIHGQSLRAVAVTKERAVGRVVPVSG